MEGPTVRVSATMAQRSTRGLTGYLSGGNYPFQHHGGILRAKDFGVNPPGDDIGPAVVAGLVNNIKNTLGIRPKDNEYELAVDQGSRHLDWTDLREQYEGRAMDINMSNLITAEQYNQRNSFLYRYICPPKMVNQMNFKSKEIEFFMAPFDRMNPLNIARATGYKYKAYSTTLDFYKRSIEAEGTLLSDPVEGPKALMQMKGVLASQFELTFMVVITDALVSVPYAALVNKYHNPMAQLNHSRQEIQDRASIYIGAEEPAKWLGRVKMQIASGSRARDLIIPTGTGVDLTLAQAEKSLMGWGEFYNTDTREFFMKSYDTGVFPTGVVKHADGDIRVHELAPYAGYSDDSEDLLNQPLRARLTQGEHMFSPLPEFTDGSGNVALTSKRLDFLGLEHTPESMTWKQVRFEKYLAANVLFTKSNGEVLSGPNDTLSDLYKNIRDEYNAGAKKDQFHDAFRNPKHKDNNNAAGEYLAYPQHLANMHGFRQFDGFLRYNGKEVEIPRLVGDIEIKTLPTEYLMGVAKDLTGELRRRLPGSNYSTRPAGMGIAQLFFDAFPTCKAQRPDLADNINDHIKYSTLWRDPGDVSDYGRPEADRRGFTFFSKVDSVRLRSALKATGILAPLPDETVDAYVQRLTPAVLHEAVRNKTIGDSAWVHLLQHTPDESVDKLLTLAFHTQRHDAEAFTDVQIKAFTDLGQEIESTERGHAKVSTLLDVVAKAVNDHPAKSVGAVLGDRVTPWLRSKQLERANGLPRQATILADTVSIHLADQGSSVQNKATAARLGSFAGVYRSVHRGIDPAQVALGNDPIWMAHESQLLHSAAEDPIVRYVYVLLLCCNFNYLTCHTLAKFGLCLFRQLYVRPFIYQASDAAVLVPAGYGTWFAAYRLAQVVAGVNAAENSWAAHAQLYLGVVCQSGAHDIQLFPWFFPREHICGRNLEPIRSEEDLLPTVARDRRSVIVLPVPVTETRYEDRIALMRDAVYGAQNARSALPTAKTSASDALRHVLGDATAQEYTVYSSKLGKFYRPGTPMALQSYRATVYYPASSDPNNNQWNIVPGAGALNSPPQRTDEKSMPAFFGQGTFSTDFMVTRTM